MKGHGMQLAREAYEAYANHTGCKSLVSGQQLPQWIDLSPEIQQAWEASAAWVAGKVSGNHDWKIPIKDKAMAERMKQINYGHIEADSLLCDLLTSIGCTKTVSAFNEVQKSYE